MNPVQFGGVYTQSKKINTGLTQPQFGRLTDAQVKQIERYQVSLDDYREDFGIPPLSDLEDGDDKDRLGNEAKLIEYIKSCGKEKIEMIIGHIFDSTYDASQQVFDALIEQLETREKRRASGDWSD